MTSDVLALTARFADVYTAFNRRDVDALLVQMTEDVLWPNGWEGGDVHGQEQVRAYWERQWAQIDPTVQPVALHVEPDGTVAVRVRQTVRTLDGALLSEGEVVHAYTLEGDLVAAMRIRG